MENLDNSNLQFKDRPTFLTVLCILTFVGAGIGFLGAVYGLATIQSTIAQLEQSRDSLSELGASFGDGFNDMLTSQIEVTKKYGLISAILNTVGNGLCLLGAYWMWSLKKNGFYVYNIGQILPLIASFGLMGGMDLGMFAGLAVGAMIVGAMIPVAFIVMYGLNLKHMK
jgi:hypothetical protein